MLQKKKMNERWMGRMSDLDEAKGQKNRRRDEDEEQEKKQDR